MFVSVCLGLFHPGDTGGLQVLPAADFITMHKIWVTFTSLLLLEPLFLDSLDKNCSTPTQICQLHLMRAGYSLRRTQTNLLVYIFVPLPLWWILPVYKGSRI